MKKILILLWIIALTTSLLSTQLYVVGEVFTATWCGFCPAARSALRQMHEGGFDYLIPLIWQQDGPYPSPNYTSRTALYSVGGIPHGQWGGHLNYVGGGTATYSNYVSRYNQLVNVPSPIDLEIDFEVTDQNQLLITANAEMLQAITTTNNRIQFIISYNLDAEQTGNYFASVMRYNEQNFNLNSAGQSGEFTHSFALENWWDLAKANVVVIIQTFDGNKTIHQAASRRLSDYIAPSGLVGFPQSGQALLSWNEPVTDLEVLGYNIYRDGVVINDETYSETIYTDADLVDGTNYTYYVTAVYTESESGPSNIVTITPFAGPPGLVQIGSGEDVNGTTSAAPINIYYRSQRGQMVYTANEINMAGFQGPGELTQLAFYVHGAPVHNLPQFHIRIKHTTAANSGLHDNGPFEMTQIIQSYAPTEGGWDMITLTEPFLWNGVDNILIDTAFDLVANWSSTGQQRIFNTQSGYRYSWSDTASQLFVATSNVVDYKPQIRLQFEEVLYLPPPQNLVAEEMDGFVELAWDAPIMPRNPEFEGYNVYRDGVMINTQMVVEAIFIDTEIEPGNSYEYYVTAVYVEGESNPSNSVVVTIEEPYWAPPTDLTYLIEDGSQNVHLFWEEPSSGGGVIEELIYDNNVNTGAYQWNGYTMGTRMSPQQACQILNIKFYTTVQAGANVFNAQIYNWAGNQPGTTQLFNQQATGLESQWIDIDVSGQNIMVDGDFVVGFGSINTTTFIGYDANLNNNRSWDYNPNNQTWVTWNEAYLIRAVVMYNNGRIAEISPYSPQVESCNQLEVQGVRTSVSIASTELPSYPAIRTRELIGYNVYRDGIAINEELVVETYFIDYYLPAEVQPYQYFVTAVYNEGESEPSNTVEVYMTNTGDNFVQPYVSKLQGNYPNPFNPETTIAFTLAETEFVYLDIYNSRGQKVNTLVSQVLDQGQHHISWNGNDIHNRPLSSGIYFYRIKAGDYSESKKMILLK